MPTMPAFNAKDMLWQTLNTRTTVKYNQAKPIPFARRYHFLILGLGLFTLLMCILWSASTTGYDLDTIRDDDFNRTDNPHWFDHFAPTSFRREGAVCDPEPFSVGDTFAVTPNFFTYSVEGYFPANESARTTGTYSGTPLSECDVSSVEFTIDLIGSTVHAEPAVQCNGSWGASLTTYYEWFSDPTVLGTSGFIQKASETSNNDQYFDDAVTVLGLLDITAEDLFNRTAYLRSTDDNQPIKYSFKYKPETNTYLDDGKLLLVFTAYSDSSTSLEYAEGQPNGNLTLDDVVDYHALNVPVENFLSALTAAVRFELGFNANATGNAANTFANANALSQAIVFDNEVDNATIASVLNAPTELARLFATGVLPLTPYYNGTTIRTSYACHVWKSKTLYAWLNSVFGIAFANFGSLWLVVMIVVTIFADRKARAEKEAKEKEEAASGKKPAKKGAAAAARQREKDETIATNAVMRESAKEGVRVTGKAATMAQQELKDWIDDLV